jgi:hypothetical protein
MTTHNNFHPLKTPAQYLSKTAIDLHCRMLEHYDSDTASISSCESINDFDCQLWWDFVDGELEASLQRYKTFLREQLHKEYHSKQDESQSLNLSTRNKG